MSGETANRIMVGHKRKLSSKDLTANEETENENKNVVGGWSLLGRCSGRETAEGL